MLGSSDYINIIDEAVRSQQPASTGLAGTIVSLHKPHTHGVTMVSCGIQRGLSRGTSQVEPWMGSKTQNIFVCKHDEGVACNDPKRLGGGNIN